MWAENALAQIGRMVVHHKRDHNLDEAELGAEALLEIVRELKRRDENVGY